MVAFLASVWTGDDAASRVTLNAIRNVAMGLVPYLMVTVLEAFAGQHLPKRQRLTVSKWVENHVQSLAVFPIVILTWTIVGIVRWCIDMDELLPIEL